MAMANNAPKIAQKQSVAFLSLYFTGSYSRILTGSLDICEQISNPNRYQLDKQTIL